MNLIPHYNAIIEVLNLHNFLSTIAHQEHYPPGPVPTATTAHIEHYFMLWESIGIQSPYFYTYFFLLVPDAILVSELITGGAKLWTNVALKATHERVGVSSL